MAAAVYLTLYAAVAVFVAACLVRAVRYARAPVHLRWELYPIPGRGPGQLRAMAVEILFLKGLWEFNRSLWWRSYPFHLGLYLAIAALAFGVAGWHGPAMIGGVLGATLVPAGAGGLLALRLRDPRLKPYTTAGDLFNLAFFIVAFGALLGGYFLERPAVGAILRGMWRFDTSVPVPGLFAAGLFLGGALAAYIPCTHMAHFIAKFFTYHQVRWDERSGETVAKRVAGHLALRPTWGAAHLGAGGARTWAEVAGANPARRDKA